MKKYLGAVLVAGLLFGVLPSALATSLTNLNIYGADLGGSATSGTGFGPNAGITLPAGSLSSFAFNFTVPLDHVFGNPIIIGVTWHAVGGARCTATLRPNFLSVARPGGTHIQGSTASSGLIDIDGTNTLSAIANNTSALKVYAIVAPDNVTQLGPLDVVTFGLFRQVETQDCGDIRVQGVWLYTL